MTIQTVAPDLARSDLLQRPPHGRVVGSTTRPLIVTPTFVSRTDATPEDERPHDIGSGVDRAGREVAHPDRHPGAIALEPDQNRAFEHWDEYWRKVHGPKFAYEEPGARNDKVLRYDQVHRIASGPSSAFRPPYRALIDADGRLVDDPAGRVPTYRRPAWDGFAYIAYGSEEDIGAVLGQEQYAKRIIADERTAFRMVTREVAREYIVIPSARHRDPVSLVKIHRRRAGLSREAFQARWLTEHADLVAGKAATAEYVRRYAQLHPFGSTQEDPEGSKIDGISVLSFASLNDVEDYLVSADHAAIEAAEIEFTDPDESEFWTAVNYSVVNRLSPELATER
ncbi:EthD domain-containing protein [Methylobacterium sp. Gmos1]